MAGKLANIKNVVFDLDNTLWRWNKLLPGAMETVEKLKDMGKRVFYMTNNSIGSRRDYSDKLTELGIKTEEKEVICTSYIAARTFYEKDIRKVYVIGEEGLIKELEKMDIKTTENAKNVLTALDRNFNYWKLSKAYEIIKKGGKHWAGGNGYIFHIGERETPGEKAISEALRSVTKQDYEVLGKPSEHARKIFLKEFKVFPGETLMIGDDLETDIIFGNLLGLKTGLVLGGNSTKEDLNHVTKENLPSIVFQDIKRVLLKIE